MEHPDDQGAAPDDPRLASWLARCAGGEIPATIALMHLVRDAPSREALSATLEAAARRGDRLAALARLWRENPGAWDTVRGVLGGIDHDAAGGDPEAATAALAAAFDRAARFSPEGSVALYALGNPALLAAATAEVVALLRAWGVLGPARRVLDFGCGIGRFEAALAPEVGAVLGLDVSAEMVSRARVACAGCANVAIRRGGLEVLEEAGDPLDLVLAVDSLPYLVQVGGGALDRFVAACARRLTPGGDLVAFNLSYRGDPAADRADVARLAAATGLAVQRNGVPAHELGLELWDGTAFHLARRTAASPDPAGSG